MQAATRGLRRLGCQNLESYADSPKQGFRAEFLVGAYVSPTSNSRCPSFLVTSQSLQRTPPKMAEIGLIASVAGVAGAGAKLSMLLYEFASTVASARNDILSVGRDISLFCAVLQQVGLVLDCQTGVQFSSTALDTTFGIVDRCQIIFDDLHGIVQGLKTDKADGSSQSIGFIAKVKWTFKRSKVRLLMGTLDSMKITLHLMLTTLVMSEKLYLHG